MIIDFFIYNFMIFVIFILCNYIFQYNVLVENLFSFFFQYNALIAFSLFNNKKLFLPNYFFGLCEDCNLNRLDIF